MAPHWRFLHETYEGGREWFNSANIFRYFKEGDKEYTDRLARAYRFNHTREVTDLVQKYIFKSNITRNYSDAPAEITAFWENATHSGLDIKQFMKLVSTAASKFGKVWIVVDSNAAPGVISVADAKKAKARVYAYIVTPLDALDMGFSEEGELEWILIRERVRDDNDPINASGEMIERFRLWTKTYWQLFELEEQSVGKTRKTEVIVKPGPQRPHRVGEVPVFSVDHVIGESRYSAPALINDIAYLDRAVANYLSNLDAIIQDQTFSQLAMPAQALMPGDDKYNQLLEMGTKRVFVYDGEGGAQPDYLSPDPKQAQVIVTVINKIISEIYHTIGMAGERTKQDNAMGIDNSSGVAKAYDFERMNSLLTSKADALENAENKLARLVMLWNGKASPKSELVKYPDTFDVLSLFDEFTIAERLALVEAPKTVRQQQMRQVIDKLFPRLAEDLRKKMEDDLAGWPLDQVDMLKISASIGGNGQPTKFPATGTKSKSPKTPATSRQGEVTAQTG